MNTIASTPSTAAVKRVGTCEVADDHLHIREQSAGFSRIADERPDGVPLPDCLLDDETSDAAGGTDDEHGQLLMAHAGDDLVDRAQRVECPRVADERQELGRDVDEPLAIVPDTEIRCDVCP